jgi:hypothetical protein
LVICHFHCLMGRKEEKGGKRLEGFAKK